MSKEDFIKLLENKGIVLNNKQIKQFESYYKILVDWNEKMNLTAITDEEGVYLKHFYDSVTIAFDFKFNNQSIVDVGAGAGFPSIPLKIIYPDLKITIVDSLTKRITFLNHLFKELALTDCKAISVRAEDYAKDNREKCDILGGSVEEIVDFTLTNNDHRSNIIIKKVKTTPNKFPRMFAKIKKQPL